MTKKALAAVILLAVAAAVICLVFLRPGSMPAGVKILVDGADPAATPVKTFDNGTATVNTETCAAIGFDFEVIREAFAPFCTQVKEITTAEAFE